MHMNIPYETVQNLPNAAWAYDTQDSFKRAVWNQAMAKIARTSFKEKEYALYSKRKPLLV